MNYHNITYPDMNNGSGLRVVLWLSGCSHKCKSCQNPQTWDKNSGVLFDNIAEEELFEVLSKDYISGITFSGGDPLHENNISEVLKICKQIGLLFGDTKTIWLYTGYSWNDVFDKVGCIYQQNLDTDKILRREIIKHCDVLVDGRYLDKLKDQSYPYAGSTNQRVIDVKKSLQKGHIVLWSK